MLDVKQSMRLLQRTAWFREDKERMDRWDFLTEGIEDHHRRRVLECMLDNQLYQGMMIGQSRAQSMGIGVTHERTLLDDVQTFITNSLPIVRCLYDELCDDFYAIQPIPQESSWIFWLDRQYEDAGMYSTGTSTCHNVDKDYGVVGEKGTVKGIKLELTGEQITAVVRKLLGDWSVEVGFRLMTQHGINPENELMVAMAQEHAREINQDILLDMVASATAGNVNWNWTNPGVAPWTALNPKEYDATLYDAIADASQLVWNNIYRYANRLIMNGPTFNRLRKLEKVRLFPQSQVVKKAGVEYIGTLDELYTICVAANFPANTILVFYQGTSWNDVTYVYAPFVTFWSTDLWTDPRDFDHYRGTMSWAARKMVRPGAFATVTLMP